jgi:hypothetical protein
MNIVHARRLYIGTTTERGTASPLAEMVGVMFYDTTENKMYFWNSAEWVAFGSSTPSTGEVTYNNITYDADVDASSLTISHTIAAGDNLCLVVLISSIDQITGVTYNGDAMSQWVTEHGQGYSYVFGLVNPDVGTYDIIISASGVTHIMAGCIDLEGVNQSDPYDSTHNVPVSDVAEVSMTMVTGELMLAVLNYWSNVGPVSPYFGQTEIFTVTSDGAWRGVGHLKTGDGTVVIGYEDLDTSYDAAMCGIVVHAAEV